jgi:hypothetical protein
LDWKNITNSQNSVRKKSFGGTFTFSNCHIIGLDTVGLVFLVSGCILDPDLKIRSQDATINATVKRTSWSGEAPGELREAKKKYE